MAFAFQFKIQRPLQSFTEALLFVKHFNRYGKLLECKLQRVHSIIAYLKCADTKRYRRTGRIMLDSTADISALECEPTYIIKELDLEVALTRIVNPPLQKP
jgi:hypothetical protein